MLWDLEFSVGLNRAFKNFRTLARNASWLGISLEIVSVNFLRILTAALELLSRLGVERFSDVTDWSQNASRPTTTSNANALDNVDGAEGKGKKPQG